VSECGIASAYLKPLKPQDLFRITKALEHGQPRRHLLPITGEQGVFAPDASNVRDGTGAFQEGDRSLLLLRIPMCSAEPTLSLGFDNGKFVFVAVRRDRVKRTGRRQRVMIEQPVQRALKAVLADHDPKPEPLDSHA
jgi:hypothetical protein